MPAIIAHDTFGREVYDRHYPLIGGSRDEADAFLLGNQGPDPLFFAVLSPSLHAHSRLGSTMHSQKPADLLAALKQSLTVLEDGERAVGRAYALGFLCHHVLDSTLHPFVYFHEHSLCDAGEPGLSRADGHEVHGIIESELDELVLFTKRGTTVAAFNPATDILKANDRVLDAISKMHAFAALTVYGRFVPADLFARSVRNYRLAQAAFHSPTGAKRALAGRIERLVRPHSFFQAMSHRPVELTESVFDNRDRRAWENPFTGEVRTESFWDLYDKARSCACAAIPTFDRPGFNVEAARAITHDLDFSGRPTTAVVLSVEDGPNAGDPNAGDPNADGPHAGGPNEAGPHADDAQTPAESA